MYFFSAAPTASEKNKTQIADCCLDTPAVPVSCVATANIEATSHDRVGAVKENLADHSLQGGCNAMHYVFLNIVFCYASNIVARAMS